MSTPRVSEGWSWGDAQRLAERGRTGAVAASMEAPWIAHASLQGHLQIASTAAPHRVLRKVKLPGKGPRCVPLAMHWVPDGNRLLAVCGEATAVIDLTVQGDPQLIAPHGYANGPARVVWAPSANRCVWVGRNDGVELRSADGFERLARLETPSQVPPHAIGVSANLSRAAWCPAPGAPLEAWDIAAGRRVSTAALPEALGPVRGVGLTRDGAAAVVLTAQAVVQWRLDGGRCEVVGVLPTDGDGAAHYPADRGPLAVGDGAVVAVRVEPQRQHAAWLELWDLRAGGRVGAWGPLVRASPEGAVQASLQHDDLYVLDGGRTLLFALREGLRGLDLSPWHDGGMVDRPGYLYSAIVHESAALVAMAEGTTRWYPLRRDAAG